MVKIADYEIVLWETDDFDYVEILKHIKKNPDIKNMCFLFHHNGKITGAVSAADLVLKKEIRLISLEITFDLFLRARDFYYKNENLKHILIPITDSSGNFLFLLRFEENPFLSSWLYQKKPNRYADYDLIRDKELLDYSFIERYDTFVFTELEEYSFAIAQLILEKFPEKKIVFTDEKIKFFYDEECVSFTESVYFLKYIADTKGAVVINSGIIANSDVLCRYFGSLEVFDSLVWCMKKKEYGSLNAGKTIFLLDFSTEAAGMVDIIKYIYAYFLIAQRRGWEAVVNLNRFPNQYLQSEKENMWEYYFKPLSSVSPEEAYNSKNVILASENNMQLVANYENIYFREGIKEACEILENRNGYCKLLSKISLKEFKSAISFNDILEKRAEKAAAEIFKGKDRVLGVLARGTDFKAENFKGNVNNAAIDTVIKRCGYLKEIYMCGYIFAATEDKIYFDKLSESFKDRLLYIEQERFDTDNKEYKPLAEEIKKLDSPKEFGYDYLIALYCLSKCDILVSSMWCGGYIFAKYLNNGKYEYDEIIKQ